VNHADHVNLLRNAKLASGGTWADLGAGTGAFTLALRELVGPEAVIYAVDKDGRSLTELRGAYERRFGEASGLQVVHADLQAILGLPPLDGVLMANSLHFFKDKAALLGTVRELLKPGGMLLLVEYNVDRGNPWVPYPLSFSTFKSLASTAGFEEPRLVSTHPSSFLRELYSASATASVFSENGA
jgi:ubiquinone/menaquinone biosynthesis C-methylase UbiE